MKISVLQQCPKYYEYSLDNLPSFEEMKKGGDATLDNCFKMLEEAAAAGADLAVTIEAVNGFMPLGDTRYPYNEVYGGVDGETAKRFSEAAKRLNIHIVAGLILTIDGVAYNCAVLFNNKGEIVGIHKKVHLPAGEELHVAHGDKFEVFKTDIGNIGMLVCWDLQFSESVRELALGDADLIAVPTLGWETTYGLARAYESSLTLAIAMGFGSWGLSEEWRGYGDPSCIVNNMGKIIAEAPRKGEFVLTAEIDIKKEPDPQYNSQAFYKSHSMRKTRFSQRRPETYRLTTLPLEETPLYKRYFEKKED